MNSRQKNGPNSRIDVQIDVGPHRTRYVFDLPPQRARLLASLLSFIGTIPSMLVGEVSAIAITCNSSKGKTFFMCVGMCSKLAQEACQCAAGLLEGLCRKTTARRRTAVADTVLGLHMLSDCIQACHGSAVNISNSF